MNNQIEQLLIENASEDYNLPLHKVQAVAKQHNPTTTDFHAVLENLAYMQDMEDNIDERDLDVIFADIKRRHNARVSLAS